PEGIFLPKDPGEYEKDVLRMKELGFNMIRKHVKVEPEQFYYACDKHGMLVLQDMVNNGGYHYILDTVIPTLGGVYRYDKWPFYEKRKEFFLKHSLGIVKHVKSHPCVIGYTIFNEGWGQFHADDMYELIKEADPNRLVDATSGWFMQSKSDFNSVHIYFRNQVLPKTKKPLFLSECGGYVREMEGHLFHGKKSYGYGKAQDLSSFMDKIEKLYNEMVFPSIQNGLVGLVYTQLCDVETEMNGLYTYDRTVCKVDKDKMRTLSQKCKDLYLTNK
nr:glycoside hydrolase family 2 [Lachnospiraceae bacterium]